MSSKIVIVDYGMGNLSSVRRKLDNIKVQCTISSNPNDVLDAEKLILPGVGHFSMAMANLKKLHLLDALNEAALSKKTPTIGICLGMQLMAKWSEEGDVAGLGWFDANVLRFKIQNKLQYKVPQIGWNQIKIEKESSLMNGVEDLSEFYFVHSYHIKCNCADDILNTTEYEIPFTSAIEKENIFGVQYHPEKSHDVGEQLLRNFCNL